MKNILIITYLLLNIISFISYGVDKRKAIKGKYRISEATLLYLSFLGPIGGGLGMKIFHHKTQKIKFKILVTFFIILHIFILGYTVTVSADDNIESEYSQAVEQGYIIEELSNEQEKLVTKEDFIKLVVLSYENLIEEKIEVDREKNPFKDTKNIESIKAYNIGFIKGIKDDEFGVDEFIDKQTMVVVYARMIKQVQKNKKIEVQKKSEDKLLEKYEDKDEIEDWAKDSFEILLSNDLIIKNSENKLGVKTNLSKKELVINNFRIIDFMKKEINPVEKSKKEEIKEEIKEEKDIKKIVLVGKVETESLSLNLRSTPDTISKKNIIAKLQKNEEVEILSHEKNWYKVKKMTGIEGYAYGDYIRELGEREESGDFGKFLNEDISKKRKELISFAMKFRGNPYKYGGNDLNKGVDCSGFTKQVFEHFGIELPRSSKSQALKGVAVTLEEAQPGDLVFYAKGSRVSHVAIYIGSNKVIHALGPQSPKCITITEIDYISTPRSAIKRIMTK